jgi:hypothetical protein
MLIRVLSLILPAIPVRTDGDCPNQYSLNRSWTATRLWGNIAVGIYEITVRRRTTSCCPRSFPVSIQDTSVDDSVLFRIRLI